MIKILLKCYWWSRHDWKNVQSTFFKSCLFCV